MTIEKKQNATELTITITGRLDTSTAPQLEEELGLIASDINSLIFDFTDLEYISSAGLRVLLKAQKKMNAIGTMKVMNVNETILEVFTITGFDSILTIE